MIAAVVLAAGHGTRLRPLTDLRPKALCPVANRPLVDLAIEQAGRVSDDVTVNVHAHRERMERHLAGRVRLSVEAAAPLGTAGALGRLRDHVSGRAVLVLNADAWRPHGLDALLDGWDGDRVRLLTVHDPRRGDFGDRRYAGAALLPWRVVRTLRPEPAGLYEACWRPEAAAGRLDLVLHDGPFVDCGTPADYLAANLLANHGRSVVGPRAVVLGELVRSVVWPGGYVGRYERLTGAVRADGLTVVGWAG